MDLTVLNERQREAVEATEGRVRVVAGAGSGKTRALAYRYAYIVNEIGVDPANILCLTFTNKAAQEMRERISRLVPPGYTNDFVCTIHGFCVKFLREEIFRIGYPKNFQILDEDDMKSLAKHVLTDNNQDRSVKTVRDLLDKLGGYKKWQPYLSEYIVNNRVYSDRLSLPHEVQLILKQKDKLALDFDDLLYFTLHILASFPEVRQKWQEKMTYVMVDETQDCNGSDWELVNTLSELNGNLFVVGDPDQAIYEWRGAVPATFVGFKSDKDIVLDENYRSTPGILNVANSIIVNNANRLEKNMFTRKAAGDSIIHFHAQDEAEEVAWVCTEIAKKIEAGSTYSDFAVLFRAAHQSRNIEQAFIRLGIPYVMWGGVRFFERAEIKDSISYLRLVASDDDLAFERVINMPSRKVGQRTLEVIETFAERESCSMYEALKRHLDHERLAKPALREFVDLIETLRSQQRYMRISELMTQLLDGSGLKVAYRDDKDEQRLENITELINSIRLYELGKDEDELRLDNYLQDIALYTNADYRKETNKVKLMTVHQSKGLEFPYVFIIGLSEGIFPNARSIRERKKSALEEERRLMYVAATRAEKCLYMTESEGYNVQAKQEKLPSRFIAEIKRELFITEGRMDEALWKKLQRQIETEDYSADTHSLDTEAEESKVKKGSSVRHKLFGLGRVEEVLESGACKVRFETGAVRFLRKEVLEPVMVIQMPTPGGKMS